MHGAYDFNSTPVAPLGTRIFVHEKSTVCRSWEIIGIDGWYLGQYLYHYWSFEVFSTNTAHSRIADTVDFFPHHFTMPFPSSADNAIESAKFCSLL